MEVSVKDTNTRREQLGMVGNAPCRIKIGGIRFAVERLPFAAPAGRCGLRD
jgi:hypothetical protein